MTLDNVLLVLLLVAFFWPVLMSRRRRGRPAPLGYVRLASRYYRDRSGWRP